MRKYITIFLAFAAIIVSWWYMGQKLGSKDTQKSGQSFGLDIESREVDAADYWTDKVSFEGNNKTEDNPWNMTAGWIEMDDEGKCIFLTPNTEAIFDAEEMETFVFEYEIHPWVKEASDGLGIMASVMDRDGTVLYQTEIDVSEKDGWKQAELNLSQYDGVDKIKLACNNGKNEDDSCDWAVVKIDRS